MKKGCAAVCLWALPWLSACVEEVEPDGSLAPHRPGPVDETHAVVEGSRDPLVARVGALLQVRCLAFDRNGFVTSSLGLRPTLRSGIGLARVRSDGWLELFEPGRIEVVCDYPHATVRQTVVMVEPLVLREVAEAPRDAR